MSFRWTMKPALAGSVAFYLRRALTALCGLVFLTMLSSCSSGSDTAHTDKIQVGSPQSAQEALAPISAVPPGGGDRPLLPGQSGTQYTPDGLPALEPKGLNADQLFAEKLKDDKARLDRLERAVTDMRREFDAMKPAIVRLTSVEGDMQDLLQQLQTLTGNPSQSQMPLAPDAPMPTSDVVPAVPAEPVAPVETQAAMAPVASGEITPKPPVAPAAPVADEAESDTGIVVRDVRSGMHDGIARLVLDLSGSVDATHDLDNTEHVLVIELPGVSWKAAMNGSFGKNPLLQSWSAKPDGKDRMMVVIQLSGPATIAYDKTLPGADGTGARMILDLKPGP